MILIADSGSTKTDWTIVENEKVVKQISTQGINPFFQTQEEIATELEKNLLPELPNTNFEGIYFYGAGCIFDKINLVKEGIAKHLSAKEIVVNSDMLGAAHALCGHKPGIACILGTGSNSCEYDGSKIISNVSPLGFILGDEGSGAVLGKLFIGSLLKNQLTPGLKEEFLKEYNLEASDIIHRVYKQAFPNRFLATLAPFINKHRKDATVHKLVLASFTDFFVRNVKQYTYQDKKVNFIGSIAYYFKDIIVEAAQNTSVQIGNIVKSPMEGLIQYHLNKN